MTDLQVTLISNAVGGLTTVIGATWYLSKKLAENSAQGKSTAAALAELKAEHSAFIKEVKEANDKRDDREREEALREADRRTAVETRLEKIDTRLVSVEKQLGMH